MYINDEQMRRMIDAQCYPFSYSVPTKLVICTNKFLNIPPNVIRKFCGSKYFVKLFCRVNSLQLSYDAKICKYIPIESIFNASDKFLGKQDKIDSLSISLNWWVTSHINTVDTLNKESVNKFCENAQRYRRCNSNSIRRIEQLNIRTKVTIVLDDNAVSNGAEATAKDMTKNLVCSLSPMCHKINIAGKACIDNYNDLKSLFHPKKRFGFDGESEFRIIIATNDNDNDSNKNIN